MGLFSLGDQSLIPKPPLVEGSLHDDRVLRPQTPFPSLKPGPSPKVGGSVLCRKLSNLQIVYLQCSIEIKPQYLSNSTKRLEFFEERLP